MRRVLEHVPPEVAGEPIEILVAAARGLRGDRGEAARRDRDVLVAQLLRLVARDDLFAAIIDR